MQLSLVISRFRDAVLGHISGSAGNGEVRTYIHKVRAIGFFAYKFDFIPCLPRRLARIQVYPWTEIQEAHREMEENKNRSVPYVTLRNLTLTH